MALVERIDAAMALTSSQMTSEAVGPEQLAARSPNGVAVVHVDEFARAVGGKAGFDFLGDTATVKTNGHTLLLHVGRKEAWMDGKPITLPFPAVRHGRNQVWCPLAVLRKLAG